MHADTPWLSVVLTTYRGERFLAATLDSLAAQPLANVEVLAIDDGSPDATPAILEAYASRLPMRILSIPHTGNWAQNTNLGLREARGAFVSLLHQDDIWLPGRLERMRALTAAHPDCGLFVSSALYLDATGRTVGRWVPPLPAVPQRLPGREVLLRLLVQNAFALPAPLFRRDLALDAGLLDPNLWFLADWKLWAALAARTPVAYDPDPLVGYRLHDQAQTLVRSTDAADLRAQYGTVREAARAALPAQDAEADLAARAGVLNTEISIGLATLRHGAGGLAPLVRAAVTAPPAVWRRYLRDSCVIDRIRARLRARLPMRAA